MANEQVRIDLEANDKASDTIDDVADKVDKLEKADPEVAVTADTSKAEGDLKDVAATADKLTAADHKIILQAKIDEARADLRALDQQLKGLDDSAATTGHKIGAELEEGTGKAKDAVHGFVGEAVVELPGVGDAVGPAGEAIGQMTEGLLAGEIAMGDLIAAAAPLALMTVAFKAITDHLNKINVRKTFDKDAVADFTKRLRDGDSVLDSIEGHFRDIGKIEFTWGDNVVDITGLLGGLGVTLEQFTALTQASTDKQDEWAQAMKDAHAPANAVDIVLQAIRDTAGKADDAMHGAAVTAKVLGVNADSAAAGIHQAGEAARDGTDNLHRFATGLEETDEGARDANTSLGILLGTLDLRDAADNAQGAIQDLNVTILEHGDDWETVDDKARDAAAAVAIYAEKLDLPESVDTTITALINEGRLDEARRLLDTLSKGITVPITAKLGRSVGPGSHILDEALGLTGVASTVVNINMPRGSRGTDVVRQVSGQARRSGRRYGVPVVHYARR